MSGMAEMAEISEISEIPLEDLNPSKAEFYKKLETAGVALQNAFDQFIFAYEKVPHEGLLGGFLSPQAWMTTLDYHGNHAFRMGHFTALRQALEAKFKSASSQFSPFFYYFCTFALVNDINRRAELIRPARTTLPLLNTYTLMVNQALDLLGIQSKTSSLMEAMQETASKSPEILSLADLVALFEETAAALRNESLLASEASPKSKPSSPSAAAAATSTAFRSPGKTYLDAAKSTESSEPSLPTSP